MSIIKVENLSKKYFIAHESRERYTAMRDVVADRVKKIFSFPKSLQTAKTTKEEFYALKDINFEIEQGDRVGIIGRNGAGKSTLLKVLSRITEPSAGRITISGRVASLLEVGTGFHPELTGRENVFLNGAILGMSRVEIRKHFDAIVDFAEVEKFLDTPVKRYSSGMYVRLAFAVAAHLEPEILVVDEVLAVGDAQFQKKCLGKMQDVSKYEGRTILFVSHNMQAISNLCNMGVYLVDGRINFIGPIENTIESYLSYGEKFNSQEEVISRIQNIPGDTDFKLSNIILSQEGKEILTNVVNGKELEIAIYYELYRKLIGFRVFLDLCDDIGNIIFRSFHDEQVEGIAAMEPGSYVSRIRIPANLLAPINYDLHLLFGIHNIRMLQPIDGIRIRINVDQTGSYNQAYAGLYSAGRLCPSLLWEILKT